MKTTTEEDNQRNVTVHGRGSGEEQFATVYSSVLAGRTSLRRTIVHLAWPAVAENLLQTMLLIVDTFMVAYYGSVSIAAAAAAGTLLWRLHMTLGCIERGTTALVARRWGRGTAKAQLKRAANLSCYRLPSALSCSLSA